MVLLSCVKITIASTIDLSDAGTSNPVKPRLKDLMSSTLKASKTILSLILAGKL